MKWMSSLLSWVASIVPLAKASRNALLPSPSDVNTAFPMVSIVVCTARDKPLRMRLPDSMLMLNQRSITHGSSPLVRKREA